MKSTRHLAAAFAAALGLFGALACDAVQPKPQCKVNRADYAAAYTVEGAPPPACMGKVLTGEVLHLQSYSPDATKAGDTPGVGIEPAAVADAIQAAEHAKVTPQITSEYSFAKFTSVTPPEQNDLCLTGAIPPTQIAVPMIPADPATMSAAIPPVALSYEWSNFVALVKATSNGIHFGASLKRTDGDCVLTYKVSAVTPVVGCGDGKKDTDEIDPATMKPIVDPATGMTKKVDDPRSGNPVPSKCCPAPNNGLSPEITYKCDAATRLCLPSKDFPSLDAGGETAAACPPK